ncbi:hypothetical protein PF008_g33259 [Phytophthora fragariae]|uniref:Uncharacterized protein n=1 Tax=Phytophthora fragariae TaxID=53985 RepID=A0A6G0PXI9_9STRA|nr:hypothetical protein PF008_g33259 [Phytophthora fragariae]
MEPVRDNLCCWCGATPCEWENYAEELWLAAGRVQRKLLRRKHRNRALRQTLSRIYLYQKGGNLRGLIPRCVAKKLMEYWPDSPKVTGSSVEARQSASSADRS